MKQEGNPACVRVHKAGAVLLYESDMMETALAATTPKEPTS